MLPRGISCCLLHVYRRLLNFPKCIQTIGETSLYNLLYPQFKILKTFRWSFSPLLTAQFFYEFLHAEQDSVYLQQHRSACKIITVLDE
jgi:hypothetical protein